MSAAPSFLIDLFRLALWLVLLAAIFVPLERVFALHPRRAWRSGMWQDIGFYFLGGFLPALVLGLPMAAIVAATRRVVPTSYYDWVAAQSFWVLLIAAFVIGEIGFYWGHRLSHRFAVLWRFHALHHRPEGLDWLINTRAHPIDLVFTRLCGLAPIYALGLGNPSGPAGSLAPVLVVLIGTIWGFVLHANVRWRLGWIEHLVATPRFHHWHHTRDGPIDRNFASMLPALDRLFGTQYLPARTWPDAYGIGDGTLSEPRDVTPIPPREPSALRSSH